MMRLVPLAFLVSLALSTACSSRPATVHARAAAPTPAATGRQAEAGSTPAAPFPSAPARTVPAPAPRPTAAAPTAGGPTPWDARDLTLEQAVAAGRVVGKPVVLYLLASWCGYCRKLEAGALVDGSVHAEMRAFYNVRVDVDSAAGRTLRRLAPGGFPTIVLLDASGNERTSWVGNRPAADLAAKLRSARL